MPVVIPDLSHRIERAEWLEDAPAQLTPEWVSARYDELDAELESADAATGAVQVVRRANELDAVLSAAFARAGLAFRQDTGDEQATSEYKRLQADVMPVVRTRSVALTRALLDHSSWPDAEREFGEQYSRLLRRAVDNHDPRNVDVMVELSKVLMGHTDIFAKATIEWRGERLPFSYARKAALDEDRDERHKAFQSVCDAVAAEEDRLQEIFDTATELRLKMGANKGMSYTELRYSEMGRFDYGPAEVALFRDAVHRYVVPLASQLRQQQAAALGVEKVHPADREIWPDPTPKLVVGVDEQLSTASDVFDAMGSDFGDPFSLMVREQLVDLPAREGKGTGAFCTSFDDARVPFIFCNSVDSPDDVKTLVHEFGHALQYWRSRDIELVDLRNPSLEACEIHSMTLELLANEHAERFFGGDADTFRLEHLRSTLLAVPYMAAVDEFQHALYGEQRPHGAAERGALWESTTRRYQPAMDYDAVPWYAQNRWLIQLHIFQYPFYYIDYALARMVSWELWLDSLEDADSAREKYLALCSAGGTRTFRELLIENGIGDPFDAATVERTMARLAPHLGL